MNRGFKAKVQQLDQVKLDFAEADTDLGIQEAILDLKHKAKAGMLASGKSNILANIKNQNPKVFYGNDLEAKAKMAANFK